MRRLIERILAALGIWLGWCGGCSDPDCMDCEIEWTDRDPEEIVYYDGFGAPVRRYQVEDK